MLRLLMRAARMIQLMERSMSTVYMTEVEQIEMLKKWWKRHHRVFVTTLSVVLLLISGGRYWQWHQHKHLEDASNAYEHLMVAFSSQDSESVQAYAQQLVSHYSDTVYADTARLIQVKLFLAAGEYVQAKLTLQAVTDHSKFDVLADVARLRLARILIFEKAYDSALKELDRVKNSNYSSLRTELRGDIFYAQSKLKKADHEYQEAKSDTEKSGINNVFLEMKRHNLRVSSTPVQTVHSLS
jgi:predicted negative regulator of RcsB-dependent stress response